MSTQESEAVGRRFLEAVDAFAKGGSWDEVDALLAPSWRAYGPGGLELDAAGIHAFVSDVVAAFSDSGYAIRDTVAQDDRVVFRVVWSGTHRGTYEGMPATGTRVEVDQFFLMRIENGKLAENWTVWDTLGMVEQLGGLWVPKTP